METTFRSDFVGKCNSFIRGKLREKERLFGQAQEAAAENAIYFCLTFSASPKDRSKGGF